MIAVCEPQCIGFAHEAHNTGFLLALMRACPEEEIIFFAEQSHIDSVRYCFEASGNTYDKIRFVPVVLARLRGSFWDYPEDVCFFEDILQRVSVMGISTVFLLSIHANSLLALKRLRRKKYSHINFISFLHGVIEYASHPFWWCIGKSRNVRWIQHFRYIIQYKDNDGFLYVSFSPFCHANITHNRAFKRLPLDNIYLPVILNHNAPFLTESKVRLATIGLGNAEAVLDLDASLSTTGCYDYEMHVLGWFPKDAKCSERVIPVGRDGGLTRSEISEYMAHIDVLLFLYDEYAYTYAQSGAFFEIFQYNKPAIFLKNRNFSFHNSVVAPFAQEVESLGAMAEEIRLLAAKDTVTIQKYQSFKENIPRVRAHMEAENQKSLQRMLCNVRGAE